MLFQSIARIACLSATLVAVIVVATIVLVRQPSLSKAPRLVKGRADPARLRTDVAFLTRDASPRDVQHPDKLELAAKYINAELLKTGAAVVSQPYTVHSRTFRNVVAHLGPDGPGALVVGAHYDAFGETNANPGADDNASGVAGLLEIARLLGAEPLARPLVLVAYSTEEPPLLSLGFHGERRSRGFAEADRLAAYWHGLLGDDRVFREGTTVAEPAVRPCVPDEG